MSAAGPGSARRRAHRAAVVSLGLALVAWGGCTRESLRIALETQQRADEVQQAVFDQQHEALCILLYRDVVRRLEESGLPTSDVQRAVMGEVWNERDRIEFWAVQNERAKALRLMGVDAKLAGEQSVLDLLIKTAGQRLERVEQAAAARAGAAAAGTGP